MVGFYDDGHTLLGLAAARDAGAWALEEVSPPQAIYFQLIGVSCVTTSDCVAVGNQLRDPETPLTLIESWDGTKWSPYPA